MTTRIKLVDTDQVEWVSPLIKSESSLSDESMCTTQELWSESSVEMTDVGQNQKQKSKEFGHESGAQAMLKGISN